MLYTKILHIHIHAVHMLFFPLYGTWESLKTPWIYPCIACKHRDSGSSDVVSPKIAGLCAKGTPLYYVPVLHPIICIGAVNLSPDVLSPPKSRATLWQRVLSFRGTVLLPPSYLVRGVSVGGGGGQGGVHHTNTSFFTLYTIYHHTTFLPIAVPPLWMGWGEGEVDGE